MPESGGAITEKSLLVTLLAINGVMFGAELILDTIADSTDRLADAAAYRVPTRFAQKCTLRRLCLRRERPLTMNLSSFSRGSMALRA